MSETPIIVLRIGKWELVKYYLGDVWTLGIEHVNTCKPWEEPLDDLPF